MGNYRSTGNFISLKPETDGFRETATAVTEYVVAFDRIDGSFEISEPYRKREEYRSIGDGRNVAKIAELGYDNGEGSLETYLQTGMLMRYVLGTVSTVGTTITDSQTVTSVTSNVLSIDSASYTENAYAGDVIEVASGDNAGERYYIISNTTDSLTVYPTPPANIATDVLTIVGVPYVHTISEADTLESFILHTYQEDEDSSNTIIKDLIGCIVKSYNLKIEAGEGTVCKGTAEIVVPKAIEGSAITNPSALADDIYTWEHLDTASSYVKYGSNEVVGNTATLADVWKNIESMEISIENDVDISKIMGDEFSAKQKTGKRDYTVKMHLFPQSTLLHTLRNTKIGSYASDLSVRVKLLKTATDYIMVTLDKLYVSGYPNKLIDTDEKILGVDVEFKNAPGGTCSIVTSDIYNGVLYYGG